MKLLATAAPTYTCPMHPDVTTVEPGRCPKCGMKLLIARSRSQGDTDHTSHAPGGDKDHHSGHHPEAGEVERGMEHHGGHHTHQGGPGSAQDESFTDGASGAHDHGHGAADGIEWEDDMVEINKLTTTANMRWRFEDRSTDAATTAIDWRFTEGDRVKIRLVNEMDSDHPMHHPFHLHGAGRFLVLARNGGPEPNLVWKDTVLVRTGQTVDILFDVTNPGLWMAHCHIAEHMQSGMMFSFTVDRAAAR